MSIENEAASDPSSRVEVDVSSPEAIQRWCTELGITDAALMKAVQMVGPRVDKIKVYLGAGGMAGQQEDA